MTSGSRQPTERTLNSALGKRHDHTYCDGCGDCHVCIANLQRYGDPDGVDARIAELSMRLSEAHHAWLRGDREADAPVGQRVEWAQEITRLRREKEQAKQ